MSGNWRNVFLRRYKTWRFRPGFFTTEAIRSSVPSSNRKVFHRATDSPRHDALPPRCCVLCRHGNAVSSLRSSEWHPLRVIDWYSIIPRPFRYRRTRPSKPALATRTTCAEPSRDQVSRFNVTSNASLPVRILIGTFYDVGLGACGKTNVASDLVAAISHQAFDNYPGHTANPNQNPICNRKVKATCETVSTFSRHQC